MSRRFVWLVAIALIGAAGVSSGQHQTSVWSGVYIQTQATAGETLYADACAKCHGEDLAGIEQAPALAGTTFIQKWHGATVGKLFERIESMPPTAPKSLTGTQYVDILAFVLSANEFPDGPAALTPDRSALSGIVITSTRPK